MLKLLVLKPVALSWTLTVKLAVPAAVGVPLIAPAEFIVSPAGSDPPVIVNVYPPDPRAPVQEAVYATVTSPPGVVQLTVGAGIVVMLKGLLLKPAALSWTLTVKFAVSTAVGVPLMVPEEFIVSPAGREPAVIENV